MRHFCESGRQGEASCKFRLLLFWSVREERPFDYMEVYFLQVFDKHGGYL